MFPPPPTSTLFPYTTLFRSVHAPISLDLGEVAHPPQEPVRDARRAANRLLRSEEHTSELQSPYDLVCRLLLEKKKNKRYKKKHSLSQQLDPDDYSPVQLPPQ